MVSEKIQQLSDELQQKLPEILSNLNEVLQKYDALEAVEVEIKLNTTKLQSSDAYQDQEAQEATLAVGDQEVSLAVKAQKASLARCVWKVPPGVVVCK